PLTNSGDRKRGSRGREAGAPQLDRMWMGRRPATWAWPLGLAAAAGAGGARRGAAAAACAGGCGGEGGEAASLLQVHRGEHAAAPAAGGDRAVQTAAGSAGDFCAASSFAMTISGNTATYRLPAGSSHTAQCRFGPLDAGTITFLCSGGTWTFGSEDCESSLGGCTATQFTVNLNGQSHVYSVPEAQAGGIFTDQCQFGDWNSGTVTFHCQSGKWEFGSHACSSDVGNCLPTNFAVHIGQHSNQFNLPSGSRGETLSEACDFGVLQSGDVVFVCQGGEWEMQSNNCVAGPDFCPSGSFKVKLGAFTKMYQLPDGQAGEKHAEQCDFGPHTSGDVTFVCENGRWWLGGTDCSDPSV
ncbi:unnamed protein product, partial [Prorocentrum cordatum]